MDFRKLNAPAHPALMKYASAINNEAAIGNVPPCALAAIVWRETGGMNELQIGMPAGPGCGVGLTQITSGVDWSKPADPMFNGYHLLDPVENLYVAAAYFLAPAIATAVEMKEKYPRAFEDYGGGQVLYYAFAEYNAGAGAVDGALYRGIDPDRLTTNGYASDTFAKYLALVEESANAA